MQKPQNKQLPITVLLQEASTELPKDPKTEKMGGSKRYVIDLDFVRR